MEREARRCGLKAERIGPPGRLVMALRKSGGRRRVLDFPGALQELVDSRTPTGKEQSGQYHRKEVGVRVAMERNLVFSGIMPFLCVTALASWMLPTPRLGVLGGESGNRFGPRTHVARERPEVSMA